MSASLDSSLALTHPLQSRAFSQNLEDITLVLTPGLMHLLTPSPFISTWLTPAIIQALGSSAMSLRHLLRTPWQTRMLFPTCPSHRHTWLFYFLSHPFHSAAALAYGFVWLFIACLQGFKVNQTDMVSAHISNILNETGKIQIYPGLFQLKGPIAFIFC